VLTAAAVDLCGPSWLLGTAGKVKVSMSLVRITCLAQKDAGISSRDVP
jgi:hypothetical protein